MRSLINFQESIFECLLMHNLVEARSQDVTFKWRGFSLVFYLGIVGCFDHRSHVLICRAFFVNSPLLDFLNYSMLKNEDFLQM